MNLNSYLKRILGTSDAFGLLNVSIEKAFHARSFKLFWRYWNPLYGYLLSKYINKPLSRKLNDKISTILTFIFSGLVLHDSWLMPLYYILFNKIIFFPVTIIFFCYAIVLVIEDTFRLRKNTTDDKIHVLINIVYILGISIVGGLLSAII